MTSQVHEGVVSCAKFSPDSDQVVSCGEDETIKVCVKYLTIIMSYIQGRNQVCSQRRARLEHFPFPDFFPRRNLHFG